jgi:C-terminal processing protease CtpA/Prc
MLETLQVIEQLSPQLGNRTRGSKQDLEPEPEPEPEPAFGGEENIPQLKMLSAQAHMMAHFELMLAEHSLDRAGSHDIKGHLREHARKVANMLSPWQPISSAFDVERTAVRHMDMHQKQCLDENAHATLSSSAVRELQEHAFAHALQIAKAARRVPNAVTTIVVRFEEPGPIGLALSSEHPFDAVWEQADANGDGKLSRRELLHVLRVMGRLVDNLDESAIDRYTAQVMNELDPAGYGMIDKPQFQRWYEAQQIPELARVRVESCDVVAARQGLQRGFYMLSVNAADVYNKTIQEVTDLVRAAGRPLTIEFGLRDGAHSPPVTPRRLRAALAEAAPGSFKLALQAPSKPKLHTTTLLFGKDQDLGLVLGSDDPLDQVWVEFVQCGSQIDQSAVGVVGRNEISELLRRMGRDVSAQAVTTAMIEMATDAALRRMGQDTFLQEVMTATSETKTGADSSHEIDIENLENWYKRQSDRKMNTVYVVRAGDYAASRGLHTGAKIMSIQGIDMRKTPLRLVLQAIKAGRDSVKAGKPMRMVIERLGSDRATPLQVQPPSPVQPKSPSSPQAQLPSPVQAGSASSPQAELPPSGHLMTVALKKDRSQQGSSLGSYGMTLSPKLKVLSLPQTVSGKKTRTGPAEKAGVQVGMVLVSINGEGVTSLTDVASKCSAAHGAGLKCTFRQRVLSSRPPSQND